MKHTEWSKTEDGNEWDDFVVQNGGSIFHSWSWRRVLENNDFIPLYLVCRDAGGRTLAVCPFFCRTGRQGRHIREMYLESLPESRRAGIIRSMAGPIVDGQRANASEILASLPKSAKSSSFNPVVQMRINVHQQQIIQTMIALGFQYKIKFEFFILDFHEKIPEHIWSNGFQKHDRQAVKYYEQLGSEFGFARHESEYHDYLALSGGTTDPNDSADFLSKMRLNLGDRLKIARVTLESKVVAGISILCDPVGPTAHLMIIRYSPVRNIHSPVTYINWKIINWAYEQGFRYVDFGAYHRSSDPARPSYKLRSRFEVSPVPRYEFALPLSSMYHSVARGTHRVLQGMISVLRGAEASNDSNKQDAQVHA